MADFNLVTPSNLSPDDFDLGGATPNQITTKTRSFQIIGCDENYGTVGSVGLNFTPEAVNVNAPPVAWSIESFGGEVVNATIDSATGEVSYDVSNPLVNGGKGLIVVSATDANGLKTTKEFCIETKDPSSIVPLACNADMGTNIPAIAAKYTLFGKIQEDSVFQDVAKTTPSLDGDPVSALADGNGNGDLTVRTGNNPPTYRQAAGPNNRDFLEFNAANDESLQYDVPAAPAPGTPFKFFALFSFDLATVSANGTLIASELQANNNSLATGTWQLSHGGGDNNFVFRLDGGGWTNIVVQGPANAGTDISIAPLAEVADSKPHLIYVNYDGTTAQVYVDGTLRLQADPGQALRGEHFKLFENRGGTDFVGGNLYEAIYADSTLTDVEATATQAYFLCKFGLDASLIADPGPFAINTDQFFSQISQFELHVDSFGQEQVYDTINGVYYPTNDVPTPGLGSFLDPVSGSILKRSIIDAEAIGGNQIRFTRGDNSTFDITVT